MKFLNFVFVVLILFISISVNAQYLKKGKTYDAAKLDKKLLIILPSENSTLDLKVYTQYIDKYWGDALAYEFVEDKTSAIKRAKNDSELLVGSFYGFYQTGVGGVVREQYMPSNIFEIKQANFRIRTYLSRESTEAELAYAFKCASYLYENRALSVSEMCKMNGSRLKGKTLLISMNEMIERSEKKKAKSLDKILNEYPYEIKKSTTDEMNQAILEERNDVLITRLAVVEDKQKSIGSTIYAYIYDPTDGAIISSSRVWFHIKQILNNAGL